MKSFVTVTCFLVAVNLLLSPAANAQFQATSICNTGLTRKSIPPVGCLSSTLVTPVNPLPGGPSVDGNWELAVPFPSAGYTDPAPNACSLRSLFVPAWVNAPWYTWYDPADGLSQWISPLGGGDASAGWYVYRTRFQVPPVRPGHGLYLLQIRGQLMSDDNPTSIYLADSKQVPACAELANLTEAGFGNWTPFEAKLTIAPDSFASLYVVVYNQFLAAPAHSNPTGLRIEFTSVKLTPF